MPKAMMTTDIPEWVKFRDEIRAQKLKLDAALTKIDELTQKLNLTEQDEAELAKAILSKDIALTLLINRNKAKDRAGIKQVKFAKKQPKPEPKPEAPKDPPANPPAGPPADAQGGGKKDK
jgi:hypothetical protein